MRLGTVIIAYSLIGWPPVAAQEADTTSLGRGVYTEPQARRGERVYEDQCGRCHLPEYFTEGFLPMWSGAPLSILFELVATQMPQDRPASLTSQDYVDVLAYIFELNGMPPGSRELPTRPEELARILIDRSP